MLATLMGFKDLALLILRLVNAAIFWQHGTGKVKTAKGGFRLLGLAETLASLAMIFGVLTQWAALGLCLVMLGAIYMKIVKWKAPFIGQNGWELDLALLGINLALLTLGPGKFALQALLP